MKIYIGLLILSLFNIKLDTISQVNNNKINKYFLIFSIHLLYWKKYLIIIFIFYRYQLFFKAFIRKIFTLNI